VFSSNRFWCERSVAGWSRTEQSPVAGKKIEPRRQQLDPLLPPSVPISEAVRTPRLDPRIEAYYCEVRIALPLGIRISPRRHRCACMGGGHQVVHALHLYISIHAGIRDDPPSSLNLEAGSAPRTYLTAYCSSGVLPAADEADECREGEESASEEIALAHFITSTRCPMFTLAMLF
jgi:hypothetical protein